MADIWDKIPNATSSDPWDKIPDAKTSKNIWDNIPDAPKNKIDFSGINLSKKPEYTLPPEYMNADSATSNPIHPHRPETKNERLDRITSDSPIVNEDDLFIPGFGIVPRGMKELTYSGDALKISKTEPVSNKSFTDIIADNMAKPENPVGEDTITKQAQPKTDLAAINAQHEQKQIQLKKPILNTINEKLIEMGEKPLIDPAKVVAPEISASEDTIPKTEQQQESTLKIIAPEQSVIPIRKPLSAQAQAVKDASEIPVGGSEDATAQAVKQAFIKQQDSQYKNLSKTDLAAINAQHEQQMQFGEVKDGEPLDDFGQPLFSKDNNRDLIITHNLTEDNLLHAKKMGGIPVPSLAITKHTEPLTEFGDITMIGSKEMADPKAYAKTKVFGSDIYSPRYPRVDTVYNKSKEDILLKELDSYKDITSRETYDINNLRTSPNMEYKFLKEKGLSDKVNVNPEMSLYDKTTATHKVLEANGLIPEYNKYVKNTLSDMTDKEQIFKGVSPTSGKRLYLSHNLENVVKILKKDLRGGEGFNYGLGSIRSQYAPQFKSVKEIKEAKGRLLSSDDFNKIKEEVDNEYSKLKENLYPHTSYTDKSSTVDALLSEIPKIGINRALKEYGFKDVPDSIVKSLSEFIGKLRDMPTEYFEAKIMRTVSPAEFKTAVIPDNLGAEAHAYLDQNGLKKVVYKAGDSADRKRAIAEASQTYKDDVMFSKKYQQGTTTIEDIHQQAKKLLGKQYDKLKSDINIVQSYKDLPKDLRDRGEKFSSGGEVRGVFDPKDGKVHLVADTMSKEEVNGILVHELLHKEIASGAKVLGESHDTIVLRLKQLKDEKLVQEATQAAKKAGTSPKYMDEEIMAYLVEKYQLGIEMSPKLKNLVTNIIDKIKVFIAKTAVKLGVSSKWLISKMNEKDIAALLKSSAIKQSEKISGEGESMFSKIQSRLQEWHKNSHPLTKNEDGTPKVFYHGTYANFSEFKKSSDLGFHIGTAEQSDKIIKYKGSNFNNGYGHPSGQNIMPINVNLKNPLILKDDPFLGIPSSESYPTDIAYQLSNLLHKDHKQLSMKIGNATSFKEIKSILKDAGYDGIVYTNKYEGEGNSIVAFESSQIKSIHNRGTFDEKDSNILFSKKDKITASVDKATEILQDYWKPVEKYLDSSDLGKEVNDARKAIYGRTGERIAKVRDIQQSIVNDITRHAKSTGEPVEDLRKDLNSFLIAQHAPERNAAIRDGAAGIGTDEAIKSLEDLKALNPTKYKVLEAWANKVRSLNEQTLDILKDGQVITPELYDTLRAKYKMHVPLQRIMPEEKDTIDGITGGKGFSIKSSGIKVAKGSDLEVSDIIGNVSANVQEAVIRVEKNRVGLKMYDMFKAQPELGEARGLKMVGKDFKDMPIMETPTDNMIVLFKDGKKKVIVPNDPIIAKVYNALNVEEKGLIAQFISPITRTIAGLYTRLNPEFAFSNVIRDIQESLVYNSAEMSGKDAIGALGNQHWAMKGVTDHIFGRDTEASRLYEQMKLDGGTTGGVTLANKSKITEDVDHMFKVAKSKPLQAWEGVFKSIDNFNSVFEDGTRLAAYKQALDAGLTRDRAAIISKETTIDFNRKGTATPWVNGIYMFSNASIQGSYKMLKAFKNPKILAGTVGTLTAISVAVDSHNDSVDPDWRDKVNDFERTSNYVILLDSKDGNLRRIDIPIGWGFKPIKTMIESIRDISVGKSVGNPVTRVLGAIASGYNPLGGNDLVSNLTPTVADVALDINRNKNWKGQIISPKGMDLAKPSEKYFPTTPETLGGRLAIKLVDGTQKIGLDLTPEDMKYIVSSYGGGPLNFSTGIFNMLESASTGKDIDPKDAVMARRFYKVTDPTRLEGYEGKQSIKKMVDKVQGAETTAERIKIIQEELPKIPEQDRKNAVNALKYGGLLPSRQGIIKQREKAQWGDNILNPFQSVLNKKK